MMDLVNNANTVIPSSSPGFATPAHPIRPLPTAAPQTILPTLLPPATLRPVAFRTLTKKHNLTLSSSALQALATYIGRYCGSGWRQEGLAEGVLEEVAKAWKRSSSAIILYDGQELKEILKNLDVVGGKVQQRNLSRQNSLLQRQDSDRPAPLSRGDSSASLGLSSLVVESEDTEPASHEIRAHLKVIDAFSQPRLQYDPSKRHFELAKKAPSLLPDASSKTALFRQRYHLIQQRVLRNESFQAPTVQIDRRRHLHRQASSITRQQSYTLTSIANLLGRSGSSHVILGLLNMSPTGVLTISDLTGSIALDLSSARDIPEDGAWFTPGMIVIVDGMYEEAGVDGRSELGGGGGVGGNLGGRFVALSVGGPPCERREVTMGISVPGADGAMTTGGGFGWVDFLGVGSERAEGSRMRAAQKTVLGRNRESSGKNKMVVIAEVNLDNPRTAQALRKILGGYAADGVEEVPMAFVLVGNFVAHAVMAGGGSGGSVEYKECFNSLAAVLAEFPVLLQRSTFVFVPGDNDPWASSFSAGAATVLPRQSISEFFTSRVTRAIKNANSELGKAAGPSTPGEAVWTTNPTRISVFGPAHEIAFFRDDMTGRLRRNAIPFTRPGPDGLEPRARSAPSSSGPLQPSDSSKGDRAAGAMDVEPSPPADARAESTGREAKSGEAKSGEAEAELHETRKLVKTVLDQGYLSPFPLAVRPVLWDHACALQLHPLPTALVLVDPGAPQFAITYEGCHVMNPGPVLLEGKGRRRCAGWMEYDVAAKRGRPRDVTF